MVAITLFCYFFFRCSIHVLVAFVCRCFCCLLFCFVFYCFVVVSADFLLVSIEFSFYSKGIPTSIGSLGGVVVIASMTESNAGVYRCSAKNVFGSVQKQAEIYLQSKSFIA